MAGAPLAALARQMVDPEAAVSWELRYYQRDPGGVGDVIGLGRCRQCFLGLNLYSRRVVNSTLSDSFQRCRPSGVGILGLLPQSVALGNDLGQVFSGELATW